MYEFSLCPYCGAWLTFDYLFDGEDEIPYEWCQECREYDGSIDADSTPVKRWLWSDQHGEPMPGPTTKELYKGR